VQAQILDEHGLHRIIRRTVPLGSRPANQSLGLWVLLPLGHVQAIEKDRSRVFFLGVMEGLSTRETGVSERKLDGRYRHLSGYCNARSSGGRQNLLDFIAFPRPARAMDDAAARLKSSPGCLDQDLRRPSGPRSREDHS